MSENSFAEQAANFIRQKTNIVPGIAIGLGSGSDAFVNHIENRVEISYADLPGFPISTVAGHAGRLVLGTLAGKPIVCLRGRAHYYEGTPNEKFKTLIRTLKLIGCSELLLTNASGSLRETILPGSLVLVNDHINFQGTNPLVGRNDDSVGPRFFAMDDAYDKNIRESLLKAGQRLGIDLYEGVYISVMGPNFETPAEIRAFRILGADIVGMSTVPDVLVARHCGLRVGVIAIITNFGAGMSKEIISHEGTLHHGAKAAEKLSLLITEYVRSL